MLAQHRMPVCLSLVSTDLPVWSVVETAATLYQKDQDRFHLLLTEPKHNGQPLTEEAPTATLMPPQASLLWLELSPYRVIMTMQGNGRFSYRHFWEQGVYGLSRYWLQNDHAGMHGQLRLRNFTRSLILKNHNFPTHLRVEYELWSEKVQLGCYILSLEVHH